MKFTFDKSKPHDVEKAKRVILDMRKRGYMLFALIDGEHRRIYDFDPEREEYLVEEPESIATAAVQSHSQSGGEPDPKPATGKRGRKCRSVPMRETRATGIAPTAGG